MKKQLTSFLIIGILLLSVTGSQAQKPTFKEWWRQKKTNREYLAKQIALLQLQLENLKKGYQIVSAGLTTIENIKNGDFNLHRDFFSSLKNVKPSIASSARVIDIIAFQTALIKEAGKVRSFCKGNKNLSATEIRYVTAVCTSLIKLSDANVSELFSLTASGQSQMSDDERIERIEKVHGEANDQLAFARAFNNELHVLSLQRAGEQDHVDRSERLNAVI